MKLHAVDGATTALHGLPPSGETVVRLAEAYLGRQPPSFHPLLVRDPGALLAYLGLLPSDSDELPGFGPRPVDPTFLFRLLESLRLSGSQRFADWNTANAVSVYRLSQAVGRVAASLAEASGVCRFQAEVAGSLSLLGWLWHHAAAQDDRETNGVDPAMRTRMLVRRMPMPRWLADVLLQLDLPGRFVDASPLLLTVQSAFGLLRNRRQDLFRGLGRGFQAAVWTRSGDAQELLAIPTSVEEAALATTEQLPTPPPACPGQGAELVWRALQLALDRPPDPSPNQVSRIEEELESVRRQLRTLLEKDSERLRDMMLEAMAELAAGAAHEINTPLAVISGQAQLLLRSEEDLGRAQSLDRIVAQAQRIHGLLQDLMLYARPPQPRLRVIRITSLLRKAVAEMAGLAAEKGVRVETEISHRPLRLQGDSRLLHLAVTALIRNGIEAAPAQGWVRVATHCSGRAVHIEVQDNGPGISAAERPE